MKSIRGNELLAATSAFHALERSAGRVVRHVKLCAAGFDRGRYRGQPDTTFPATLVRPGAQKGAGVGCGHAGSLKQAGTPLDVFRGRLRG